MVELAKLPDQDVSMTYEIDLLMLPVVSLFEDYSLFKDSFGFSNEDGSYTDDSYTNQDNKSYTDYNDNYD